MVHSRYPEYPARTAKTVKRVIPGLQSLSVCYNPSFRIANRISFYLPPASGSKSIRKSKRSQDIRSNKVEDCTLRRSSQCTTSIRPFFSSDMVAVLSLGQVRICIDFCTLLLGARNIACSHTRLAGEDHLDPALCGDDVSHVLFFFGASSCGIVGISVSCGLAYLLNIMTK